MWTHRIISQFFFSLMLLVQAHAAVPHQHQGGSGSCGAVCHVHEGGEDSWWEAVVQGVHDLVHRHAETSACESEDERYRPASELEFEVVSTAPPCAIERIVLPTTGFQPPQAPAFRSEEPMEVRPLRGPPSRG